MNHTKWVSFSFVEFIHFYQCVSLMLKCWFQIPLTAKSAMSIGERLKVLVLLHSLVEGDEAQIEVLHILLPAMISAASAEFEPDSQVNPIPPFPPSYSPSICLYGTLFKGSVAVMSAT